MNVANGKIECLQGEKFAQLMSGFDFASATQIVVLLYDKESTVGSGFAKSFVKVADETKYPSASLITLDGSGKMKFNIDATGMAVGEYDIEVSVDFGSSSIVKNRTKYLLIKESRT